MSAAVRAAVGAPEDPAATHVERAGRVRIDSQPGDVAEVGIPM